MLSAKLGPCRDLDSATNAYDELKEATSYIDQHGRLDFSGIGDVSPRLAALRPSGMHLLPDELLVVKQTLSTILTLKGLAADPVRLAYPLLSRSLDSLKTPASVYEELDRVIDDKGRIRDDASFELREIRKSLNGLRKSARKTLEAMISDETVRESLHDDFFTIREDRYVLCVKAASQSRFPGIVHGRSATGATYFIEPFSIVESNNRAAILKKEEAAEEIKILKRATLSVLEEKEVILEDLEIVYSLDLIQAKALFKCHINGVVPALKKGGRVNIPEARHPIMVFKELRLADGQSLSTEGRAGRVVPVDVILEADKSVLVVSGANAGGKTVSLKTLGLLTLMGLCALPVPAGADTELVFFEKIYADIGDRQNITEDLSTFSAHLKRTSVILENAGPSTLVLIDEIGAGTDPSEAGALALSVLQALSDKGAKTVVTTHLNLLKAKAESDASFENASVVFDEATLRPKYRLKYGMPGASFGLTVAESYGIPASVIESARAMLGGSEGAFIDAMKVIEQEKERAVTLTEKLREAQADKEKALKRLRDDRAKLLSGARKKVELIVDEARGEIRTIVEKVKAQSKADLDAAVVTASAAASTAGLATASLKQVSNVGLAVTSTFESKRTEYVPSPGDSVIISGSGVRGTVLKVDRGKRRAQVGPGNLKVWSPWTGLACKGVGAAVVNDIRSDKKTVDRKSKEAAFYTVDADTEAVSSVLLLGMRAEEAIKKVSRIIDNAHLQGLDRVTLIHGIGTGRLKKALHEYLKTNRLVRSFEAGDPMLGAQGSTIVEIL